MRKRRDMKNNPENKKMPEKCCECGKIVYVTEKLVILNRIYHKSCFKCTTCGKVLTMKNYAAVGGKSYCQPHYPAPGKDNKEAPPPEAGSHYGDASRGATQLITTEVTPIDYSTGQVTQIVKTNAPPPSRTTQAQTHAAPPVQDQGYDQGYDQPEETIPSSTEPSMNAGGYDPNYDYGNY